MVRPRSGESQNRIWVEKEYGMVASKKDPQRALVQESLAYWLSDKTWTRKSGDGTTEEYPPRVWEDKQGRRHNKTHLRIELPYLPNKSQTGTSLLRAYISAFGGTKADLHKLLLDMHEKAEINVRFTPDARPRSIGSVDSTQGKVSGRGPSDDMPTF